MQKPDVVYKFHRFNTSQATIFRTMIIKEHIEATLSLNLPKNGIFAC